MNFRTTLILLIVLIAVGLVILFTRDAGGPAKTETAEVKLLNVTPADVTRIAFVSDDGQKTSLEKADGQWKLTEPVKAVAEESTVGSFVDAVTGLKSRGQVDTAGANASTTGLDQPRFKIELTTKDNKTIKIDVGTRSATGGNAYIKREGQSQADVVAATLVDQLEKPLKEWRSAKLFTVASPLVSQIRIATTQNAVALEKQGEDWKLSQPTSMPADPSVASDLAIAVTSLRAEDFVSSTTTPEQTRRYGLDQPTLTIAFGTATPSTQPSASQPSLTSIQFGRYDDVMKKNVYASIAGEPGVFKVAAGSLEQFRKKPIELRDKRVLNIDPERVTKVSIDIEKPATTQPTTKEASHEIVVLERNKQTVTTAPATQQAAATTGPSTGPATVAATQPAEPPAKWKLTSKDNTDADDFKVEQLLSELHPLKADKYIESLPVVQVAPTIALRIETTDAVHELRFSDPGDSQPVNGTYNGLNFQVPRSMLDKLQGDFVKSANPAPGMGGMPPSFPGMMPPGMR